MTLARGVTLVGAVVLMSFAPPRIDNRLFVFGGIAVVIYDGMLLPALSKTAFSTLDPKFRPEGTALFNLSRVHGSAIGIAVVQIFFYNNTQAMHLALAKDLAHYRAATHVGDSIAGSGLALLNDMVTRQAAMVAVIDQFKILMLAMLIVSPLVLFLRKPRSA